MLLTIFIEIIAALFAIIPSRLLAKRLQKERPHLSQGFWWGFFWGLQSMIYASMGLLFFLSLLFTNIFSGYIGTMDNNQLPMIILFVLFLIRFIFGYFVVRRRRWAWIISTIFSLNPILWIVNTIYLVKRWHNDILWGSNLKLNNTPEKQ